MDRPASALRNLGATLCRGGLLGLLLSTPLFAQGGRLDQVFLKDSTRQETGTVIENGLTNVLVERDGKEKRLDAARVDRIIWGAVCSSYREAQTYFDRGDFENAAAKFGLAATEDERPVIQAVARRRAGEALMRMGASDPSQFQLAIEEFDRFLGDNPDDRSVPIVRAMKARGTLLRGAEGDVGKAGAEYRSLFESGTGASATTGYDLLGSLKAGLQAVRGLTEAGDTLGAREVNGVLTGAVRDAIAALEPEAPEAGILAALRDETQLNEGFILLAAKQAPQAQTFFLAQLKNATGGSAALRYGAMLGLGEAYVAQGEMRQASLQFATVAAIDYTDRDRSARALLRLAETLTKLGDSDGSLQARKRLEVITTTFGDTPSAAPARKLLETL